jgi:outer membrane protein OmpA-like peptidoglycan-associated protein
MICGVRLRHRLQTGMSVMKSFGATVGVEGRRAMLLLFCGVAFAAALTRVEPAQAQDRGEVPIGTFNLQTAADSSPSGFSSNGGSQDQETVGDSGANSWFLPHFDFSSPGPSEATDALFKKAVEAFDAGRSGEAQHLLEKVIAEAPGSALATKARRYLATLYSRSDDGGPVEINTGAVVDKPGPEPVAEDKQAPRTMDTSLILAKSGGTHVPASVEEEFLLDAGDRVFFSTGSAELGVRARTVLQAQARFMAIRRDISALVEGHADDGKAGKDEQVLLSQARAEAVRDRLVAEGVGPERLIAVARGRDAPVSACPDPACAAQNRRAITVLVSTNVLQTLKSAHATDNEPKSRSTQ